MGNKSNIDENINLPEIVVTPEGGTTISELNSTPTITKYLRIKVQPGDNLTKIAKRYNTTIEELSKINNIKNNNEIQAGKELRVIKQEKTNPYYALSRDEAIQNIMKVRKIDKKTAERIISQGEKQGSIKFDGTYQLIMPSKDSVEKISNKIKEENDLEKRRTDPSSRDFDFTHTYVKNQKAAWEKNPEVMQAFKEAGDVTGYGTVGVALAPYGGFVLNQLPWIAGVEGTNYVLDRIAGNNFDKENFHYDADHWANNRYLRGLTNTVGMVGGNFIGNGIKGVTKYGSKYLTRAFNPTIQRTAGSFTSSLASMEGMTAADHLAESMGVENPFLRAGVQVAGMIAGDNLNRFTFNKAKSIIGQNINKNRTQAIQEFNNGNTELVKSLIQKANKQEKLLTNSLISKSFDVKGNNSNPIFNSTMQHLPILTSMETAALVQDATGSDILHNPILQAAMIKGSSKVQQKYSDIAYESKIRSGLKSNVSEVLDAMVYGTNTATGTYRINNLTGNEIKKQLFPEINPEQVTKEMIYKKIDQMSNQELHLFANKFREFYSRIFNHFELSDLENGYVTKEHNKGNSEFFTSTGNILQGVKKILPKNFTEEQFLGAVAGEGAGARHGFGFEYGTMIPRISSKVKNLNKAEFIDNTGKIQPVLINTENGYLLNPEFVKTRKGFRGQDTFLGYRDNKMWFSNVAGHNGFVIRVPNESGQYQLFKIGVDTPGYGDTSSRYKGASQFLGSTLGKTLDYFTERPQYTLWIEPINTNEKLFGTTTNVQSGNSNRPIITKKITAPVFDPMNPDNVSNINFRVFKSIKDILRYRQKQKTIKNKSDKSVAEKKWKSAIESIEQFETTSTLNKNFESNFKEGQIETVLSKIKKGISIEYPFEEVYKIKDFLNKLKNNPEISEKQKQEIDNIFEVLNINEFQSYASRGQLSHTYINNYYKNDPNLKNASFQEKLDAFKSELSKFEGKNEKEKYNNFQINYVFSKGIPNFYKINKDKKEIINVDKVERLFSKKFPNKIKKEFYYGIPENVRTFLNNKGYKFDLYKRGGKIN